MAAPKEGEGGRLPRSVTACCEMMVEAAELYADVSPRVRDMDVFSVAPAVARAARPLPAYTERVYTYLDADEEIFWCAVVLVVRALHGLRTVPTLCIVHRMLSTALVVALRCIAPLRLKPDEVMAKVCGFPDLLTLKQLETAFVAAVGQRVTVVDWEIDVIAGMVGRGVNPFLPKGVERPESSSSESQDPSDTPPTTPPMEVQRPEEDPTPYPRSQPGIWRPASFHALPRKWQSSYFGDGEQGTSSQHYYATGAQRGKNRSLPGHCLNQSQSSPGVWDPLRPSPPVETPSSPRVRHSPSKQPPCVPHPPMSPAHPRTPHSRPGSVASSGSRHPQPPHDAAAAFFEAFQEEIPEVERECLAHSQTSLSTSGSSSPVPLPAAAVPRKGEGLLPPVHGGGLSNPAP